MGRNPGGEIGPVYGSWCTVRCRIASHRTCRLVFRMRLDRALSCFDSYALERRLGSGLLLRHPQVSNQNSKRADSIRRRRRNRKKSTKYPCPFPASSATPTLTVLVNLPSTIKNSIQPSSNHIQPIRSTRQFCAPTDPSFCDMDGERQKQRPLFVHRTRLLRSLRATRTRPHLSQTSFLFLLHPCGTPKGQGRLSAGSHFGLDVSSLGIFGALHGTADSFANTPEPWNKMIQ